MRSSQANEFVMVKEEVVCNNKDMGLMKRKHEFKLVQSDDEIEIASKKKFAPESKRKIKWVLNM